MAMTRRSRIPLVALLGLVAASALPAERKGFDTRWKEAEQNVKSGAGEKYFNDVFFSGFR